MKNLKNTETFTANGIEYILNVDSKYAYCVENGRKVRIPYSSYITLKGHVEEAEKRIAEAAERAAYIAEVAPMVEKRRQFNAYLASVSQELKDIAIRMMSNIGYEPNFLEDYSLTFIDVTSDCGETVSFSTFEDVITWANVHTPSYMLHFEPADDATTETTTETTTTENDKEENTMTTTETIATVNSCDCSKCCKTNCPHRDSFRRLPTSVGGLGLCTGMASEETTADDQPISYEEFCQIVINAGCGDIAYFWGTGEFDAYQEEFGPITRNVTKEIIRQFEADEI